MPARRLRTMLALAVAASVFAAAPARAEIVYDQGTDRVAVAADDGSGPRTLVTAAQVGGMRGIGAPAVSPSAATVVFEGYDSVFDPRGVGDCGSDCVGVYRYDAGVVRRVSGTAPPCSDPCDLIESQPEIGPAGTIVAQYEWATWTSFVWPDGLTGWSIDSSHSWTGLTVPPHGDPVAGAGPGEIPTLCSGHDVADQPQYPSLSPDGRRLVYANCRDVLPDGSVRYATAVENTGGSADFACAEDDRPVLDPSFSLDGATIVDGEQGDSPGLWRYPSSCTASGTSGSPVYVLAAPSATVLQSPRYTAARRIVFVAQQTTGAGTTGDVWSIPSSCGAGGTPCRFPDDATQLTRDGDVTNVGWTAASIPPPATPATTGDLTTPPDTSPAPPATPTTPVTTRPAPAPDVRRARVALVRGRLGRPARGVVVSVRCPAACGGRVTLGVAPAPARRLRIGRRATDLGSARFRLRGAGARRVTVPIRRRYRARLRRERRLTVTLTSRGAGLTPVTGTLTLEH